MTSPPPIALLGSPAADFLARLQAAAGTGRLTRFASATEDARAIVALAPGHLVLHDPTGSGEEAGALRVLRDLLPACLFVITAGEAAAAGLEPLRAALRARFVAAPGKPAEWQQLFAPGASRDIDLACELARALSDEINNPLLFVAGHVQLLRQSLDADRERDLLARLVPIAQNLQRIEATMARVRLLVKATTARASTQPVMLAPLLLQAAGTAVRPLVPAELATATTPGDPALVQAIVEHLASSGLTLAAPGTQPTLALVARREGLRLRLELTPPPGSEALLPRDFEPYELHRLLRASGVQLSLLVVQAVAQALGGAARGRARPDGRVVVEVDLRA